MTRSILLLILCLGCSTLIRAQDATAQDNEPPKIAAEVTAARAALQEHPKFKKFYEHLAANPDSLATNGPKLAVLLTAEAKTSAAIKDHEPSLLATWQEVIRLAEPGADYKTAFPAIDSLQKHPSNLLTPAAARLAKGKILVAASVAKTGPGEREAVLELARELLKESPAANDAAALPQLLSIDARLGWSTTESANSVQLLLPFAEQAVNGNQAAIAKLLLDHLDARVLKTAAGKTRKDFADAIAAARERLNIVESAQQSQQILATKPLDPAANQAYGRYLLACGQAKESLTYLALGSDPEWKKLAAESLEVTAKDGVEGGKPIARLLYQEALADKALVGIPRAAAEEKLKGLGPAPTAKPIAMKPGETPSVASAANKPLPLNEWTELLPLIDFDQDLVRGFFSQGPRNSVIMDKSPWARLRLPVLLEDCSYDLAVEFKPGTPAQEVHLLLPVGKQAVALFVDATKDNQHSFFDVSSEKNVKANLLQPNQNHRYDIAVRLQDGRARVSFSLDGKFLVYQERPVAEFKLRKDFSLQTDKQPALAGFESNAVFTSCQVRPISGTATIGRDVPLIKPNPASVMALKATSLTTMRPLATKFTKDWYGVNRVSGPEHPPIVGGALCPEYLYCHAPAAMTYAVPPKAKYFTAIVYSALSCDVKFIVRFDGKEAFSIQNTAIAPAVVEIPDGAKEMQLICDPLGNQGADHSFWCYPAFR